MESTAPDDMVIRDAMRRARTIRRVFWVVCLWMGAWVGLCLGEAVSWTNFWDGFMNGATMGVVLAPMSLIILIPLGLIGRVIGSMHILRPYRWWIALGLPLLFVCWPIIGGIRDRIEPGRRFERITKVRFPSETRNLEVFLEGGLFIDITETYSFECSPEESGRLIQELNLKKQESIESRIMGGTGGGFSPTALGWRNPALFAPEHDESPGKTDFFEMFVDEARTRVHITLGTI